MRYALRCVFGARLVIAYKVHLFVHTGTYIEIYDTIREIREIRIFYKGSIPLIANQEAEQNQLQP